MKSTKLLDLTPLRAQLMLAIYSSKDFMKANMLLLPIGTIIYLYKDLLVVMLIQSLELLELLIVL